MHEVERMIRLILEPNPQRGRDVYAWVCDASGYSARTVRMVAEEMESAGGLRRGMWVLPKSAIDGLEQRAVLYDRLSTAIFRQREAA